MAETKKKTRSKKRTSRKKEDPPVEKSVIEEVVEEMTEEKVEEVKKEDPPVEKKKPVLDTKAIEGEPLIIPVRAPKIITGTYKKPTVYRGSEIGDQTRRVANPKRMGQNFSVSITIAHDTVYQADFVSGVAMVPQRVADYIAENVTTMRLI